MIIKVANSKKCGGQPPSLTILIYHHYSPHRHSRRRHHHTHQQKQHLTMAADTDPSGPEFVSCVCIVLTSAEEQIGHANQKQKAA